MMSIVSIFKSTVGKKFLMAISGVFLVLFVIVHSIGNLLIFAGPDAINTYAATLKSMPAVLWGARASLLLMVVIHLVTALQLKMINSAARNGSYEYNKTVQASLSSRTMLLSGSLLLMYIIGHILHFTVGVILPENAHLLDSKGRVDVYTMVVRGFQLVPVSAIYIVAMLLLFSHLSHGIASVFQSLGMGNPNLRKNLKKLGPILAGAVVICYISIPAAVILGILA